ncbi:hypothetical protein NDA10_004080 [Ustilago hordei]|uniref:uncharacterized protein n=1 Tax=Ustilago hordei TaxID=120017 RepID=UPI001A5244BB|nr:uncharacterized protein UHO2_05801 [Ustilago hordei]KAJ1042014.1 hypothetical protein NDA10_004080 [Ustilago hordei]KAJ1573329.1 hypothetical protein NDA15_004826 [Ustilago hordei]KAJ1574660.1 hypothetical protein NDA12_000639 [Ustilago hordei]UTT88859.1 hypothetical protein NDA17_007605 [Ustilago hordei]SYW84841.1 uncharacterized protein UHO2_05801 [Ustilago hordei]
MTNNTSRLTRQGSVARTNAIAMLKRAASQREIKARADTPSLPGAFPTDPSPPPSTALADQPSAPESRPKPTMSFTRAEPSSDCNSHHGIPTLASQTSMHSNGLSSDQIASTSNQPNYLSPQYITDNAMASTSSAPTPSAMLSAPSPNHPSDPSWSRPPMFQDRSNQRTFNRSPLPSLEQLRARILLERESAGLQRSASTSAASQAARAYALEKLLGNSGTDVFYDHTPDGTPIGRGAATSSPTPMSGRDSGLADMASDDESAHETRLKRQSIKHRPGLRRSRTINGLTAMAEAQNKAEFVQAVFLAVPGPASNRFSRIHQRRMERQSMFKATSTNPSEISVAEVKETSQEGVLQIAAGEEEDAGPSLSRQQSQRQIARTEMMRKLSTRGRGNAATGTSDPSHNANGSSRHTGLEQQHPRLPKVIADSPAVDETISPVGVVIRSPSSPAPPHISHLDATNISSTPAPAFRQALSPASAAGIDSNHYTAAPTEDDQLAATWPGFKASSSVVSLASNYAPSTGTARHVYERDRESRMAILNNEDSFGYEASPSLPSTSVDVEGYQLARKAKDDREDAAALHASASYDGNASHNDGLNLDFGDSRSKRRAGLVGLGLDSVPQQQAPSEVEEGELKVAEESAQRQDPAGLSPGRRAKASPGKRVSKLRQSLARLRVQPNAQDMLSSPASQTDEEALEDDAFYKLYSPAAGGYDDDDDDEETDEQEDEKADTRGTHLQTSEQANGSTSAADATAIQGLGLVHPNSSPTQGQTNVASPTTPPQRLFRGNAAVPCDPSPSTETEFGEARRTPWMTSSPGGFNLPLRLSNSLMSTAQAIATESPVPDPSPVMRSGPGASRKTCGDWPMSVASSGTAPLTRESLESRSEADSRIRSSEEGAGVSNAPVIRSPLLELPEDEVMDAANEQIRAVAGGNGAADSKFELLSAPSSRAKPSERVQAMLESIFVAEYRADLADSRSPSLIVSKEEQQGNLKVPITGVNGLSLSNNTSNVSINEISDVDGEVDDAYLRKVDRMADKLGKLARNKTVAGTGNGSTRAAAPATNLERSNTTTLASRFTEHVGVGGGAPSSRNHSQRPSADLNALVGNEKLHPFPALAQASPLQSQDGFSPMAVSAAPPVSSGSAAQRRGSESPPSAFGHRDEQEGGANGKQIRLFSSLRRKASSLRRTPSAAANKESSSSFWARRAKREGSPKLPNEATFISAPILTPTTPGPTASATGPTQPVVTVDKPRDEVQRENDGTFENRLFDSNSSSAATDKMVDLQRNASISSVVSARIRTDLQDGTADIDATSSSEHHTPSTITSTLGPNTAIMLQRYSRILSTTHPSHPITTIPGLQPTDIIDPPRKLLASDPVFQVISSTTIKDRFLFLFSDLLVIAKPINAPGSEAGRMVGKMKQASILPDLGWNFAVKNILELHRVKLSVTTNSKTASGKSRAQNPVLWGFVSHFSRDPDSAVRALVAKTGLESTPASIAQLLYQTPELDRGDLTNYLTNPSRREILKSYVAQHRHIGVSIESALRSLLLDLRFPSDLDAFEALLVHFAHSWTQHNKASIKPTFTSQLASDLVFAIMALNDALHTGSEAVPSSVVSPNFPRPVTVVTPGLFSAACPDLSKQDFVSVFRQHDPTEVLSDRTLSRIYLSIKAEPLIQALDRYEPRFTIRVKGGKLPTRLTYAQPAEPVTLVIPAPDPDLAIRLYAQDTTFEPPILTFSASREATFTMRTKSLGPKQVVFVRAGRNARFYGGSEVDDTAPMGGDEMGGVGEDSPLPRSFNVVVERAFMKHSFTLTCIPPGGGGKGGEGKGEKRFMLSFEDGAKVTQWTKLIKDQAGASIKAKAQRSASTFSSVDVSTVRAVESASLQILRETLIAPEPTPAPSSHPPLPAPPSTWRNRAATVIGTSSQSDSNPVDSRLGLGLGHPPPTSTNTAMLDRTTSTSRHYYAASGVGRHERELLIPTSTSTSTLGTVPESGGGGVARGGHTKGSASLTLYPPSSTMGGRGGGAISPSAGFGALSIGRSNSARSASSPHHQAAVIENSSATGLLSPTKAAGTGAGSGGTAGDGKVMSGTQIVSITRLNSVLSRVIGHLQQQQQHQSHQQQ